MGLLDDAIREHLDLQRRRGADPAEVERAEREALGPVRRNRDPSESLDSEAPLAEAPQGASALDVEPGDQRWDDEPHEFPTEPVAQPGLEVAPPPVFDDAAPVAPSADPAYEEPPFDDEPVYRDEPAYEGPAPAPPAAEPRSVQEPAVPASEPDDRSWSAADDLHEPFPTAPAPAPRAPDSAARDIDPVGEPTAEYHIEERLPHDDEDADEDVLEETPEFLQDTPDHDRLWFEQRPPRDFDFDG